MGDVPNGAPRRSRRWFFIASFPCAAVAVGASLWWSYGGETTAALVLSLVAWLAAGALGFASGYRGEHARLTESAIANGLLAGVVTLGATFGAAALANFRTTPGNEPLSAPVSAAGQWPTLAAAAAAASGNGDVLAVHCDKTRPNDDEVATCAVTFDGPRCQYWFIGSADGEDQLRAGDELFEERGTYDEALGPLC